MDKTNKDRGIIKTVFESQKKHEDVWLVVHAPATVFVYSGTGPQSPRLRQEAIIKEKPVYICIKQTKALKQETEGTNESKA